MTWSTLPALVAGTSTAGQADQAATLRRLFARRSPRVLPVLVPDGSTVARAAWLAKLAQAFARSGERTLLVDAARAQVAASLGLRARFDLLHLMNGECAASAAMLDAGANLAVLPAARAFAPPARLAALAPVLEQLAQGDEGVGGASFDLLLCLIPASAVTALPDSDVLVPVLPEAAGLPALLAALASANGLRCARAQAPLTGRFRLLFLGMAPTAAATLAQRLVMKLSMSGPMPIDMAGSARTAHDLVEVVRSAAGWHCARLRSAEAD